MKCFPCRRRALARALVVCAALVLGPVCAAPASSGTVIGPGFPGEWSFGALHNPEPGVGETILGNGKRLKSFSIWVRVDSGGLRLRPELRSADGSRLLRQGRPVTIGARACKAPIYDRTRPCFRQITFALPKTVALARGRTYLIDAQIVRRGCSYVALWMPPDAAMADVVESGDGYPPGTLASEDGQGVWESIDWIDLAFTAVLGERLE